MDPESDKSTPQVAADLVDDIQRTGELNFQLAKREMRELAISNVVAGASFATSAYLAITAVLIGVPVLLIVLLPWHWQVAAIWIVVYLLGAGVGALVGKLKLRLEPPRKTIESLKENRDWVIQQVRSAKS